MKPDCQWLTANLEAYFCEKLDDRQLRLVTEHLESCAACNQEVQSLRDVDHTLKQLFRHRLAQAQSPLRLAHPSRGIAVRFGLPATGLILAVTLGFMLVPREPLPSSSSIKVTSPPTVATTSQTTQVPTIKTPEGSAIVRTKPDVPDQRPTLQHAPESAVSKNAPAFVVIDPAGYSTNLSDYRGYALLFGVWSSDQPEAAMALERLYQTFGTDARVRILGVSRGRQNRLTGTTFPIVFNSGSRLLEAEKGEFFLIDTTGTVRHRGSLLANASTLVPEVRTELEKIGIR